MVTETNNVIYDTFMYIYTTFLNFTILTHTHTHTHTTVLNLTLCYYAISDREKLKRCFCRMLQISDGVDDEDRYLPTIVSTYHTTYNLCVHLPFNVNITLLLFQKLKKVHGPKRLS